MKQEDGGYGYNALDQNAIAVSVIDANHIHNIPTTTMLLARFDDVKEDWFDPAEQFNNHGFRLHYVSSSSEWQANEETTGRQIEVKPWFKNNRDRIFASASDACDNWLFWSGEWSGLEYFPHVVENAVPVGWCDGTCRVSVWDVPDWQSGLDYTAGDKVGSSSPEGDCFELYTCTLGHTSGAPNQPGTGGSWQDCWLLGYPDVEADLDIEGVLDRDEEYPGGTLQAGGNLVEINTLILSHWPDVGTNELDKGTATETVPPTLYIEGVAVSASAMDVRLKFMVDYAGIGPHDKVNFTVE